MAMSLASRRPWVGIRGLPAVPDFGVLPTTIFLSRYESRRDQLTAYFRLPRENAFNAFSNHSRQGSQILSPAKEGWQRMKISRCAGNLATRNSIAASNPVSEPARTMRHRSKGEPMKKLGLLACFFTAVVFGAPLSAQSTPPQDASAHGSKLTVEGLVRDIEIG